MQRRLLIADDEADNRVALAEIFERRGYRVKTARDGCEAVELAATEPFSLGIFDFQMPRLNGLEAIQRLRAIHCDLPVMLTTSTRADWLEEEASACGALRLFYKPLDFGLLRRTVVELIGEETGLSVVRITTTLTVR